jgi:hypothetical protein
LLRAVAGCGSAGALASRTTRAEAPFVIVETVAADLGIGSLDATLRLARCELECSGVAVGAVIVVDVSAGVRAGSNCFGPVSSDAANARLSSAGVGFATTLSV